MTDHPEDIIIGRLGSLRNREAALVVTAEHGNNKVSLKMMEGDRMATRISVDPHQAEQIADWLIKAAKTFLSTS